MSQSFSNNTNSLNTTVNISNTAVTNILTLADDRRDLLCWLSPLDPKLRHQDIQARRVEDVGEWLLETEEFRRWDAGSGGDESDNAVLFCYGDPGVGKTYISSLVMDALCDQAGGQNANVACFYFDFAAQKEQSPTSMLGALLRQLVCGVGETPEEISLAYQGRGGAIGGRGPKLSDIVKMMQATSSKKRTFICIDALDECMAGYRIKILDSLNKILEKSPGTRIFVTGRPHIRPEIQRCLAGRVVDVSITPKRDDIIRYLHSRLHEDTTPDAMDSGLEADILKKIPEDISEIFLLVSLNIDAVLQETTIHRRRQKLDAMTSGLGLGDAYSATMDRIKEQGGEKARLGMSALMWISHSERPLNANELCHALAVEIGSSHLNSDNVPSIGTLLACCQGLVTVDGASIVRLIHYTLQEYLRAHPEIFGRAHSAMAETCLSYLNSQQVKALSISISPDPQGTPFLEYSSLYWGVHAKRDLSDCGKSLALKLLGDYNRHISAKILLKRRGSYHMTNFDDFSLFSGLHCASLFGIVEVVAGLVEVEGCDINQADCGGNTPLVWAALSGHEGVVKLLLGRDGVSPSKPDRDGQTPLYRAVWNGHEGVVKILLRRNDVSPDRVDRYGETPLLLAARYGYEGMVKMLLRRNDVSPNKPDVHGQTPLWYAAKSGHEGVVRLLLGRGDISPDKLDRDGRAPFWWAARIGHEGVVKLLLGRDDVNPDRPDVYGQTPLWWAAKDGHEGVVKLLLRRDDVNPDKPDRDGQTPFWWAARNGHEGVVKLLLGRGDISPDKPDRDGQTPLYRAAWNGQEGVVELLLRRGDVSPDKPDAYGQTPLYRAAWSGQDRVVKLLLGRDDVNPDKQGVYGRTPLCRAAWSGEEGVVKLLLGRDDVNPDKPDMYGRTPLYHAAGYGQKGVVKLLLIRGDVNPDKQDVYGRTPLYHAAGRGKEGVVKLLLGRDDVNPGKPDNDGQTPLWSAAENNHAGIIALLEASASSSSTTT